MPTFRPARTASTNSTRFDAKKSVTHHQSHPVDTGRERAIGRHEEQQEDGLPGRGVALDLGSTLGEDEDLPRRLEHVVGAEEQEHQQRHQQRAGGLVLVHVRDRRQQALDS